MGRVNPGHVHLYARGATLYGRIYARVHTHPFIGPLSGTTRVSWYQKGKTNLDFTEARESEWQWHLRPRNDPLFPCG